MQNSLGLLLSGIYGFLGVLIGAFGAHSLKERLTPYDLEIFKTGTFYHLSHALALGLCAGLGVWAQNSGFLSSATAFKRAQIFFTLGIFLFSFSLYALAITHIKALGIITPFGGIALLVGWAFWIRGAAGFL